jgi:hypothetical protein
MKILILTLKLISGGLCDPDVEKFIVEAKP